MLSIVDIVYHNHDEFNHPQQVLDKHSRSLGFVPMIKDRVNYEVVSHLNYEGKEKVDGVSYSFFRRRNAPWQIPFNTHRHIQSIKPDVVLVHGFIFPLQVIALKLTLGKHCSIILHHHADQPMPSVRMILQKIADRFVDAYLFTSKEIAKPWLQYKIIRDEGKCIELLGAATYMQAMNRNECKLRLGISGNSNFLWVGRLNANKDPVTVLKGFSIYLQENPQAKLYMIYQTTELLLSIETMIGNDPVLAEAVLLLGEKKERELPGWYSAADFFISGSHSEGSGYALVEAMHCGSIPVVTSIPSFKRLTANGQYGFLYEKGNAKDLANTLKKLSEISQEDFSKKVLHYAKSNLSFKNIADELFALCSRLAAVKR